MLNSSGVIAPLSSRDFACLDLRSAAAATLRGDGFDIGVEFLPLAADALGLPHDLLRGTVVGPSYVRPAYSAYLV
jgi:hypothetical protein